MRVVRGSIDIVVVYKLAPMLARVQTWLAQCASRVPCLCGLTVPPTPPPPLKPLISSKQTHWPINIFAYFTSNTHVHVELINILLSRKVYRFVQKTSNNHVQKCTLVTQFKLSRISLYKCQFDSNGDLTTVTQFSICWKRLSKCQIHLSC